jgi:hypothetical protein
MCFPAKKDKREMEVVVAAKASTRFIFAPKIDIIIIYSNITQNHSEAMTPILLSIPKI